MLPKLHQAGFYGVMLDTAQKDGRHLLDHILLEELSEFVEKARALGLYSGLAGSLREHHIEILAPLQADYLGFRGGVCENFERRSRVSGTKIFNLHQMLYKSNTMQV